MATKNCTFIKNIGVVEGACMCVFFFLGGGGVNDFLQLHKKSPVNLFFLISNPGSWMKRVVLPIYC